VKVVAKNGWFAARPSGTEDVCKIYEVKVTLGELDPDAMRIEFYAAGAGSAEPSSLEATGLPQSGDASNGYVYSARAPATHPASDYTARVIPHRSGVAVPLEASRILWQR
jgi:starch phosphorylase